MIKEIGKYMIVFLLIICVYSCKSDKKTILIDGFRIEGDISSDTVYNGLIKYYDIQTNVLIKESYFIDGKATGLAKEYYSNGKVALEYVNELGKKNGPVKIYDLSGDLIKNEFYYYDVQVGSSISYNKSGPEKYYFYSFDSAPLFWINYDSAKSKIITDIQSDYFFYNVRDYSEVVHNGIGNKKMEIFVYTPSPPLYDFRYSLIQSDSGFNNIKVIKEFSNTMPWSVFTIEDSLFVKGKTISIRLLIKDEIAGGDLIMYKKIWGMEQK